MNQRRPTFICDEDARMALVISMTPKPYPSIRWIRFSANLL